MKTRTLLGVGIGGALLTALCCFTPLLAVLLAAVGLGAATGYLDYVLLPALVVLVAIIVYALAKQRREQNARGTRDAQGPNR